MKHDKQFKIKSRGARIKTQNPYKQIKQSYILSDSFTDDNYIDSDKSANLNRFKQIKSEDFQSENQLPRFNRKQQSLLSSFKLQQNTQEKQQKINHILKYIQQLSPYDSWTDQQIYQENQTLFNNVKLINQHINDIIISHRRNNYRKYSQIRNLSNNKPSLQKSIKIGLSHVARQIQSNDKVIQMLRKDFQFVNRKLINYEDPGIVISLQVNIRKDQEKIKILQQQIANFKKKNILSSQKLTKQTKNDYKPYLQLKQQYLNYMRKKNYYESKIQKQQESKINHIYEGTEVQQKYISVKEQFSEQKTANQPFNEHNITIYNTYKKKLQLKVKKIQRQEDTNKQKYYNRLKQLQRVIEVTGGVISRCQKVSQKIDETQIQISNLKQLLKNLETSFHQKVSRISKVNKNDQSVIYDKFFEKSQKSGFMLTELQQKKQTKKIHRRYLTQEDDLDKIKKVQNLFEESKIKKQVEQYYDEDFQN